MTIDVTIKGLTPLLQAKHPTPEEEKEILKRMSNPKAKVKNMTDDEQFNMHAYRDPEGNMVQPSEMIEAAMTKAAVQFKMEGKKTYKDAFKAGVIIEEELIKHKIQEVAKIKRKKGDEDQNEIMSLTEMKTAAGKKQQANVWYKDARWGRNKNTGGAVWVVRPRLDQWELDFTITVLLDELIPQDIVKEVLKYAGAYVGIGAWRPKFGRFEVIKFNVKK